MEGLRIGVFPIAVKMIGIMESEEITVDLEKE